MRKLAKTVTALVVLGVIVLAVFRAWFSRGLILEIDGRPAANLHGFLFHNGGGESPLVPTTTDRDGRLDLSGVPWGADSINVELRDGAGVLCVPNTPISLPRGGFRKVVQIRGN